MKTVKGYIVDLGNELIAFVKEPYVKKGRWTRTHPSVLLASCDYCLSPKGTLCMGSNSYITQPHSHRRKKLKGRDWQRAIKSVPGLAVSDSLRKDLLE